MSGDDPVIAAALEYESATLDAVRTLEGSDGEAKRTSCLRFANAVAVIHALPTDDQHRGLTYLKERGRIPDDAWRLVWATMEIFVAEMDPNSSDRKPN
jgi:hypothetical protein